MWKAIRYYSSLPPTAETVTGGICSMKKVFSTQVFSCEIWEIVKNTYFEEHTANDCCHVNITLICEAFSF